MDIKTLERYCKQKDIVVDTYTRAAEMLRLPDAKSLKLGSDGCAIQLAGTDSKMILYNDALKPEAQYLVFAHELAHHALGHLAEHRHKNYGDLEAEADVFAAVLMALAVFDEIRREVKIE